MKTDVTRPRQPPIRPGFAGIEPDLREILADPIVRTLMARDGVGIGDIRHLVGLVGRRDLRRPPIAAGPDAKCRRTVPDTPTTMPA